MPGWKYVQLSSDSAELLGCNVGIEPSPSPPWPDVSVLPPRPLLPDAGLFLIEFLLGQPKPREGGTGIEIASLPRSHGDNKLPLGRVIL